MLAVVSAGNEGVKGIAPPSDSDHILSVGSVDFNGTWSNFSSVGPTYDRRIKPDSTQPRSPSSIDLNFFL